MRGFIRYIILALTIFFIYLFFHGAHLDQNIKPIQFTMIILILVLSLLFIINYRTNHILDRHLITLVILGGFIMRIGYMVYTSCLLRPHDIGDLTLEGYGHGAYILKLLIHKKLPETNLIQFYHPPLFHFLGALVSGTINKILGNNEYYDLVDAAKIVSCFASCGTLLICQRFCQEIKLKTNNQCLVLTLLAFFPNFFLLAGRVNNDSLLVFLMSCGILYTYMWYQTQSLKNTICLALSFGFGMMTKTSCIVLAFFTFLMMCLVLYRQFKAKNYKHLIRKFFLFAGISLPLGLWYPLRNYLLFKQPLNYVLEIPKDYAIYCGNEPIFQRFFSIDLSNIWATPYAYPWKDFNLPTYVIKTSLFGEFTYTVPYFIPFILLLLNMSLIACSIFAIFKLLTSKQTAAELRLGLPLLWGIILIFFIYFNISYPFGCTMDFRYIMPTVILGSLSMGLTYHTKLDASISKYSWVVYCNKAYEYALPWLIVLFTLFSFLMFVLIKE